MSKGLSVVNCQISVNYVKTSYIFELYINRSVVGLYKTLFYKRERGDHLSFQIEGTMSSVVRSWDPERKWGGKGISLREKKLFKFKLPSTPVSLFVTYGSPEAPGFLLKDFLHWILTVFTYFSHQHSLRKVHLRLRTCSTYPHSLSKHSPMTTHRNTQNARQTVVLRNYLTQGRGR